MANNSKDSSTTTDKITVEPKKIRKDSLKRPKKTPHESEHGEHSRTIVPTPPSRSPSPLLELPDSDSDELCIETDSPTVPRHNHPAEPDVLAISSEDEKNSKC